MKLSDSTAYQKGFKTWTKQVDEKKSFKVKVQKIFQASAILYLI